MGDSPQRIWIEAGDDCPYFYEESELAEVGSPVTEYIRADLCHRPTLDPSAARELALEALKTAHASMEGSCSANHRIALNTVDAAIRALSSPDYADADHAQARDVLARFRDYVIEGITAGTIMRGGEHHNPIWQEVAGVLHADAGKVEGDGWHVEYEVYSEDEWQAASTDLDGALDYAVMYAADGFKNITVQEVRRRTLPSVPSEGAE